MSLPSYNGFSCGWSASSGGTLSGHQRVARRAGLPEPTKVLGAKGPGRADRIRTYTVFVVRDLDQERLEAKIGPAYWSKKRWVEETQRVQRELLERLGWTP